MSSLFDTLFSVLFILGLIGCLMAWLNDVGQGHPESKYRRPDRPAEGAGRGANLVPPEPTRTSAATRPLPTEKDRESAA